MDDKNPRLDDERIGGRGDEYVTGRERTGSDQYTQPFGEARPVPSASYVSAPGSDVEPDTRTREIRRDIEQTREDLSETVNAIQHRLSPSTIASNAADSVRSAASDAVRDISDSESVQYARANPIPTAMVGIGIAGLAWLAFAGREGRQFRPSPYQRGTRDWRRGRPGSYERGDYDRASGSSSVYPDRTGARRPGDFSDVADDVSRRARQTTEQARNQLQRTWNESPLLIGAASAVLGAIVGIAVPETERENELMGEARDSMIEGVQHTVRERVEDVQQAATGVVEKVQNAVGLVTDSAGSEGTASTTVPRRRGSRTAPGSSDPNRN